MTPGRVRPAVQQLAAYRPGKGAKQAEAEHGITNAIKLASNENPYSPVPAVEAAIVAAVSGVNRYADHRATELRSKLADWLGVTAEQVAVGCGSVGLLQQLGLVYIDPGDEVVYPWLSFEAYPITVKEMGGVAVQVPLVDHRFDLDAIANAVTDRTKMILLATPNNPTGTALNTAELGTFLQRIPDDVIVLVDEAYREFAGEGVGDPVRDLIPHHQNVVVTRTFSKAYGLAGLRTGYAVAHPDIILELDKVLLAFSVNMLAQVGALAALDALPDIQVRIDQILAERDRVVETLATSGWQLPEVSANFVFIPLGARTDEVALELERRGVVVRPFSGAGIRVTIGSRDENERFLSNLTQLASPTESATDS
ncbi:MAG: histidinol-phosphate aminotransferase [Candidatus Poriferisodalaceae bacterium]|jgi:histidinol-phosphate aminotransferase